MIVYDSQIDISQQICATSSQKIHITLYQIYGGSKKKNLIKKINLFCKMIVGMDAQGQILASLHAVGICFVLLWRSYVCHIAKSWNT